MRTFSLPRLTALILCFIAFYQSLSAQDNAVTATPPPNGWMEFHERLAADAKARADQIKIIFVGDSITARWSWVNRGKEIWDQRYAPIGAINIGISADGTQHVLWRLQHGIFQALHPQVVVMMIGTNNLGRGSERVAYGVWKIVEETRTAWPDARILLLGIFPRQTRFPDADSQVAKTNEYLATLDDGKMVKYLYIGDKFLLPDGSLNKTIFTDGIHPETTQGYQIWSDAIQSTLTTLLTQAPIPNTPPPPAPVPVPTDNQTYTPDTRYDFMVKHKKNLANAAKGNCDLLFLGDAIMSCWDRPPNLFKNEYGAYKPLNFAIWESTLPENVLWQIQNGELDGIIPKLVIVQMQDALRENKIPVEKLAAGMDAIAKFIRTKLPESHVLLIGGFPLGEKPDDPLRQRVAQYNALLAKSDDDKNIHVLDLSKSYINPDGSIDKDAIPSINPSLPKQFEKWADAQRPIVQKVLGAKPQ